MNELGYSELSPRGDIKNGVAYEEALSWGINNENVKNIALAGPYGSGKSSIIKYYLDKHPEIKSKSLNISLATFNSDEKRDGIAENSKENTIKRENEIELGILKQLFYKVDSNKLPQSRYKKIQKKHYIKYFLITAIIVFIILSGISFFLPDVNDQIHKAIEEAENRYNIDKFTACGIAVLFGLAGSAAISYIAMWLSSKIKVKEINLWGKLVAGDKNDEGSVFDKTMDEIVYFFETTKYELVFIEDLDRFESTKIFMKLRELNALLNDYELIKRKITFVYAVRDDMFNSEERVKFFDFTIPVIPFINPTNSMEILLEKFDKDEAYEKVNIKSGTVGEMKGEVKIEKEGSNKEKQVDNEPEVLLYGISYEYIRDIYKFIGDMRMLNNICNEFIFYKKALGNVKLDTKNLFSILILKNIYPEEFVELQEEKGAIKQIFDYKKTNKSKDCSIRELATKDDEHDTEQEKIIKDEFWNKIKDKKLLIELLHKGYINENYAKYINYFYPNSITENDMDFICGVEMRKWNEGYSYTIDNAKEVWRRLSIYEFRRKETLNFDIMNYLLENKIELKKYEAMFEGLEENGELIKFFEEYLNDSSNSEKNKSKFTYLIYKHYKDFCEKIIEDDNMSIEKRFNILYLILEYSDDDDILKQNIDGKKGTIIEIIRDFLEQNNNENTSELYEKIKEKLDGLELHENMEYVEEDGED